MKNPKRERYDVTQQSSVQEGKYLELALLGRPRSFETDLPVEEAFEKGELVSLLRANLTRIMQDVRDHQSDDPSFPKRPFLRRLLSDVEDALARNFDLPADYMLRIHSAVDSILDLGGIDFWVELYDEEDGKVISDYKIDLKSNPHKPMGKMADYLYYCDEEIASKEDPKAIFDTSDYRDLVSSTASHLARGISRIYSRKPMANKAQLQKNDDLG